MRLLLLMSAMLAGLAMPAMARPVSYPGGWTVMQMNDSGMSALHIHYTPSIKYMHSGFCPLCFCKDAVRFC